MDDQGRLKYIQAAVFDRTDHQLFQQKIINSIIETEDRERVRFAEDLHDALGPLLSTARMYINLIQIKTPKEQPAQAELIGFTKNLLDEAVQQARNVAYNLMPEVLEQYGVISSIKSYCNRINKTGQLNIEIKTKQVGEDERFEKKMEIALYRVLKELIYNTFKHAKASHILILFRRISGKLSVEYSDDGIGFNVDQAVNEAQTLGVRSMMHRIESVGASFNIFSSQGKGMRVVLRF